MEPRFTVQCKIQRPIAQVFDAVYNPAKLSQFFTTALASAPLDEGTEVMWEFADYPGAFAIKVTQTVPNELITFEWPAAKGDYNTTVEIQFTSLGEKNTLVQISESGWKETEEDLKSSYSNCEGWSQMCACLKAWVEYGINLRVGYY